MKKRIINHTDDPLKFWFGMRMNFLFYLNQHGSTFQLHPAQQQAKESLKLEKLSKSTIEEDLLPKNVETLLFLKQLQLICVLCLFKHSWKKLQLNFKHLTTENMICAQPSPLRARKDYKTSMDFIQKTDFDGFEIQIASR